MHVRRIGRARLSCCVVSVRIQHGWCKKIKRFVFRRNSCSLLAVVWKAVLTKRFISKNIVLFFQRWMRWSAYLILNLVCRCTLTKCKCDGPDLLWWVSIDPAVDEVSKLNASFQGFVLLLWEEVLTWGQSRPSVVMNLVSNYGNARRISSCELAECKSKLVRPRVVRKRNRWQETERVYY